MSAVIKGEFKIQESVHSGGVVEKYPWLMELWLENGCIITVLKYIQMP